MIARRDPTVLRAVIGDACVEIAVHDDAWLDVAAALEAGRTGPVIGRIECGGSLPAPPDATPDFVDGDAQGWTHLPAPHLVMGAAHVRLGARTVTIAAEQGRGPEAFHRALPLTLTWLLGSFDRWVIHAAAIVGPDGSAVVAFGQTGAGKSSVAAAALAAGWLVLADDLVVVRLSPDSEDRALTGHRISSPDGSGSFQRSEGSRTPEVCGIPLPLAVPREFTDFGPTIPSDPRSRRRASADLVGGWWPVGRIAVLAHGREPTTTSEPLNAMDAFRVVRIAHFAADVPARMAGWLPVAGQLARLPAIRVALGADPVTRLATTSEALSRGNSPPSGACRGVPNGRPTTNLPQGGSVADT